jgi:lipopolysaccharide exporter
VGAAPGAGGTQGLAAHARSGAGWASLAVLGTSVLSILQVAIASRFLSREDFGVMALVLLVIGFAQTLADFGIVNSILHHQDAGEGEMTSLFWLSVATCVALTLVTWFSAPIFAALWHEPRLLGPLHLVSPIFVFVGLSQIHVTLMRRELRFGTLASLDLCSAALGVAVVTGGVLAHWGVYALVAGQLAAAALRCVLAALRAWDIFVPRLHFAWSDVRHHVGFGSYQIGERLLNYSSWNVDKFLIGLWLGANMLGTYHLAYQLMIRPFRLISTVNGQISRPLLARLQSDRAQLLGGYFASVRIVALLAFPIYLGGFLVAPTLVSVLYGPRWSEVATIFRILCPIGILYCVGNPIGAVVVATGKTRLSFLWNLYSAGLQVTAVLAGARFGLEGVAVSILLVTLCVIFPSGFYMRWALAQIAPRPFLACLGAPLLYASLTTAVLAALALLLPGTPAPLELLGVVAGGALLYGGLLWSRERPLLLSLRGG